MMLSLKGVMPPNGQGLDFDVGDDTTELFSKGLITADLLTTPAPVCVRMCPDFTAATFAHGNCVTPAEIRRKFRNGKRQDNVLTYFNLDEQLQGIQDGLQKVLSQEAWYVRYSKNCKAEFGSVEKKYSPTNDASLKKSRRSAYKLMLGGNTPVEFRKPTIAVLRVSDDECMRLAEPAKRPKLHAPFNNEYVKLNDEYLGLDSNGVDVGWGPVSVANENLGVVSDSRPVSVADLGSGSITDEVIEEGGFDIFADSNGVDVGWGAVSVANENLGGVSDSEPVSVADLGSGSISDEIFEEGGFDIFADSNGVDVGWGAVSVVNESLGGVADSRPVSVADPGSGSISDEVFEEGRFDIFADSNGVDVGWGAVSVVNENLGGVADSRPVSVADPGSGSISDEIFEEGGFDIFADGTADDLFPDDDKKIIPVRVRKFNK